MGLLTRMNLSSTRKHSMKHTGVTMQHPSTAPAVITAMTAGERAVANGSLYGGTDGGEGGCIHCLGGTCKMGLAQRFLLDGTCV